MGAAGSAALPTGRVALLFSDIEGSTALLNRLGAAYGDVLDEHDRIMRGVFERYDGHEFSNEGDSFGAAFADPRDAVRAALEAQQLMRATSWPAGERPRVRVGIHYGEPKVRGDDYWGEDVHFAARVCSAAHGGQVVLSAAMRATVDREGALSLGHHGLKDFPTPRELFQLLTPGGDVQQFPAPRTLLSFHNNLPSVTGPIYGRSDALDDLQGLLRQGRRLVTLIGPGGIGKTRVAIALGERVAAEFPDGVAFVALAAADHSQASHAIADAVGAPRGGETDVAVVEHLRERRMALILDNCEHLLDEAATLVADLLGRCPGVAVFATSQVPLGLADEAVRRLEPLTIGRVGEHGATPGAAVEMFIERARARDASFALSEGDLSLVGTLCELLAGFPLAIELAAARVRVFGIERLVAALERNVDTLASDDHGLPTRQRSLRAALDWTLSLLTPAERLAFAALGSFAESWSVEQAEQLFAGELDELVLWDVLSRLIDASLVLVKGDGRFAMPERVRRHAQELLAASSDETTWRRRHAEVTAREMRDLALEIHVDYRRMLANVADLLPEVLQAITWTRANDPRTHRHVVGLVAPGLAKTGQLAVVADDVAAMSGGADEPASYDDAALAFATGLLHAMRWSTETDAEVAVFERAARGYHAFGDVREAVTAAYRAAGALETAGLVGPALNRLDALAPWVAQIADPRWHEEWERRAALIFELDDAGLAERRHVLTRWGIGTGSYSVGHDLTEAILTGLAGDPMNALTQCERALREAPRQQLFLTLDHVKCAAWLLAELGWDGQSVELRAAIDALYRARTGAAHGDALPEYGVAFSQSEARLGAEEVAHAQARGSRLRYDDLIEVTLRYATAGVRA